MKLLHPSIWEAVGDSRKKCCGMLGKATGCVPLVTGYVVRDWTDPREVGGWGPAVAMQAEQILFGVKDSRGRPKHSGRQTWLGKWA